MITKKVTLNFFLFFITLFAIFFYGYNLLKNKGSIKENSIRSQNEKLNEALIKKGITKFSNVEYKTIDKNNNEYLTNSQEAILDSKNPNLIKLIKVHSFTTLRDGSILNVRSNKAEYYKNTKNIKYYDSVSILNKKGEITSEIANFFANKNIIRLEKNIIFKDDKNVIKGDVAELNTITNNLEIYMLQKEDRVYGQRK